MFGTPSHGLTNMLEKSASVSTFPLRLCSPLENLGGICGFVARARLLHSALHKEDGDAVRPREVVIGRGMRGMGWSRADGNGADRTDELAVCTSMTEGRLRKTVLSMSDHDVTRT